MTFIDEHQDRRVDGGPRWGVEPICEVLTEHHLAIAPATCYAAKTRPLAARAVRDAELTPLVARVHQENYGVYGARKMHAALRRDGLDRPGPDRPADARAGAGRGAAREDHTDDDPR